VTDSSVTRPGVEQFVADLDNLGRDFLDRYVVFTTSGSTGVPRCLSRCRAGTTGYISTAIGSSSSLWTPEGHAVPPGTRSDGLLVTNLANYVQPVIRYQLGDSVVISDEGCGCGSPPATIWWRDALTRSCGFRGPGW
jgi:hypothetical protein